MVYWHKNLLRISALVFPGTRLMKSKTTLWDHLKRIPNRCSLTADLIIRLKLFRRRLYRLVRYLAQRCVSNQIFKYSIPNSGTIWFHGETRNTEKKKSIWYFTITNTDFIWCASNHRALSLNPAPIWQIDFKSSNHIVQNIKWSQFRFDTYYLKWWFDSVFIGFDIGIFK